MGRKPSQNQPEVDRKPIELKHIHTGDTKVRAKLRFEVVTARVIETGGKKHVVSSKVQKCILKWQGLEFRNNFDFVYVLQAYTIMMKRVGHEPQPAVIERRYNDFCFIYECILRSFHPSILGDFQVNINSFKEEVLFEKCI